MPTQMALSANVKGRPVVVSDVKIQKIHHLPEPKPVNEVAHGTPENGGNPHGEKKVFPGNPGIKPEKAHRDTRGDKKKKEPSHPG